MPTMANIRPYTENGKPLVSASVYFNSAAVQIVHSFIQNWFWCKNLQFQMISFTTKSKFINKQWIWTHQILTRNVTDERSSHLAPYYSLAALLQKAQLKGEYNLISAKSTIGMYEKFNFCERKDVSSLVTASFRARTAKRLKQEGIGFSSNDKRVNALVALASHHGSGKTVNMAHLPCSKEFREYVEYRQSIGSSELSVSKLPPLVCLLGFNSYMSYSKGENTSLGLRIVYAALHSTNNFAMKWDEFRDQYQSLEKLSGSLALELLRRECGADRLIFLGIDELKTIERADSERGPGFVMAIAHELGVILNTDGRTDVLVTSLTPQFANKLVTNCRRDIEYFPIHPLMNGELNKQFEPYGQRAVDQVKTLLVRNRKFAREKDLNPVNERILRSMHLLASGHPRTVVDVAEAVDEGSVLHRVATLLTTRAVPNGYLLLKELASMRVFTEFCSPPSTNKRREIVLSLRERDDINDTELRMMLEENQCYLFKLAHHFVVEKEEENDRFNSQIFVPTITLATFFRMVENIDRDLRQDMHVGPLSRAAHVLFGQLHLSNAQFAALWERCCALDQVSRVNFLRLNSCFGVVPAEEVCGLDESLQVEGFGFDVQLSQDLKVKVAVDKKDMQWTLNTLFVAPPEHPGFDLMMCVPGLEKREVFIYKEIKVQPLSAPSAKGQSIDELLAHKLRLTLQDHVERCGMRSLAVEEQLAALDNVLFVLSVYGAEWLNDRDAVLHHLTAFKGEEVLAGRAVEGVDLAIRFVEERWHQVAFQGTREMKALMLPVVQPVAQIVQAVVQE